MTREESKLTIDYLKSIQEGCVDGEGFDMHPLPERYALDKAIELIEQTRWIPVSERPPEDGQKVLVTIRSEDIIDVDTCIFHHASAYWKHYVIAWMPLPESYNEENKTKQGLAYADQDTLMSAT